jgi:hypothetical protein
MTWSGHLLKFHCMCLRKYVNFHFLAYNNSGFHSSELVFQVMIPCSLVDGIPDADYESYARMHLPDYMVAYLVRPPQSFRGSHFIHCLISVGDRGFSVLYSIQTSCGTHPVSCAGGTKGCGQSVKMTTHLHLVLRLGMFGASTFTPPPLSVAV